MTNRAATYEAPASHPFRGAIRTIDEIAEMTGRKAWQIREFIRKGETIPLSRALIAEDRAEGKKRSKRASARGVGAPGIALTIDGHKFDSLSQASKATKKSVKLITARIAKHGNNLRAEHLEEKKRGGNILRVTIDGKFFGGLKVTAEKFGVSESFLQRRVKEFGLALTSAHLARKPYGPQKILKPKA